MKMRKFTGLCLAILLIAVTAAGCKKESTPTAALDEKIDLAVSAPQSNSGSFNNGPYGTVTGNARVYLTDGKYQLALENFNTSNGPDLKVYISMEQNPAHFINLGSLKSTIGNQVYDIPAGVVPKDYAYALIFCRQYNHLFGYVQLIF